jgi:hypothetical protein
MALRYGTPQNGHALTETGYKPTDDQRFKIFLTNSLEEAHPDSNLI